MLRSMYSGISGLKNFQTKLDVIGNNISNVNTYGFKKSRVTFKDMISQNVAGASAPSAEFGRGGVNPKQVGLGSQIAAIDTVHTGGNLQSTGRLLDLAISGDGYFVLQNEDASNTSFTRAGNFYLDVDGHLVNSDGLYVMSTDKGKITIDPENSKDISISTDGTVSFINLDGATETAGTIQLAKFANTAGLQKAGNNLFVETTNSGAPIYEARDTLGTIESSMLEMSNVDLSEEFTEMIVAQRAFQANTRIITTSDEVLQELVNLKR
ncbi:flagellar basal body rod protein FlgG [Bacillus sp. AGMB 02131]|uniref:Flagellar hook protein FlgE n=1 Tax=Peribacillus faecalis TaxID=2772559 RepID=A0A927CXG4_9BACI|nr:flagellar basal body rod protein FlgG [Peribacillus faecalis]MBD3109438.1 flagellar basal body rod protein FlgG [Peribacillus faecalis]